MPKWPAISVPFGSAETYGKTARLEAAKDGSVAGSRAAAGLEDSLRLCPIEDRRGLDSTREGMMQGFSLGSYVQLVDYTGRLFRQGKASISAELAGIFERLGCSASKLAEPDGEAPRWPVAGSFLRYNSCQAAGDRRTPRHAAAGERGGLFCQVTAYRIASNRHGPTALPTLENVGAFMHI